MVDEGSNRKEWSELFEGRELEIEEQNNYSFKHYKPYILEVKAKILAVNKKVNEAYKLCEQSQNLRQEVDSYRDTLRRSDLAEKLKLKDLENQIQISI